MAEYYQTIRTNWRGEGWKGVDKIQCTRDHLHCNALYIQSENNAIKCLLDKSVGPAEPSESPPSSPSPTRCILFFFFFKALSFSVSSGRPHTDTRREYCIKGRKTCFCAGVVLCRFLWVLCAEIGIRRAWRTKFEKKKNV